MGHRPCSILLISLIAAAVQGVQFTAPGSIYRYSFRETAPAQSIDPPNGNILQVECTDNNGNQLDTVTYSIIGGNSDPFWLNQTTGQLSWRPGQILDYENTTVYMFSIMCVDNLGQNDTAMVNVSVIPVNEYAPNITSGNLLSLVVREDTPVGTVLLSTEPGNGELYTVEDRDGGLDGQLTFSFASQTSPLAQLFQLDSSTGALSVARILMGNAPPIISGMIIVCDTNRMTSECPRLTVTINVTADIRSVVNVALLESTEMGTRVAAVTCPESDRVPGAYAGIVIQSVSPSQFASSFDLNTNSTDSRSGAVILRQPLDYETLQPQQVVNITLTCFDSQSPPNMVSFDVVINVLPVNDVTPQFNQTRYEFTIDIASGVERICCVLATDGDRDVGGNVTYSIVDTQGRFSIQNNGEITFVLSTLTDKVGTTFVVEVIASDGELSSTVPATISVIERPSSFGVTGIIIVAVCGAAVVVIVIILLICCCCIRYYTTDSWTKKKESVKHEKPEPLLPVSKKTRASSSQAKKVIRLEEMA